MRITLILCALVGLMMPRLWAGGNFVLVPPQSTVHSRYFNAEVAAVELPGLDMATVNMLDLDDEKNGRLPLFSRSLFTNLNTENAGVWTILPNGGRVWRLHVTSAGAMGLIPYYNRFYLPEGATLHVYSPDKADVSRSYTAYDNPANGYFCTGLVHGNAFVIEYYEPAHAYGKGIINLNEVGYAYRHVPPLNRDSREFGTSDPCEVNANCAEGSAYQDPKRSAVRIVVQSNFGQGFCSGSLINNARQDCTPYLLSAQHCSQGTSTQQYSQWVFYFNYEAPGCNNPASEGSLGSQTLIGCTKKSDSNDNGGDTGSDFILLQLNTPPPANYNAYLAGWNNNNTAPTSGVSIHHPDGDIKKISTYTQAATSTQWGNTVSNTHWRVRWSATTNGHGVTEPGSSGGALFNAQGEIVGQLTGGDSYCNSPNAPDDYGKFSYSWVSNGSTANRQLQPWLDPDNTGLTSLPGTNIPCVTALPNDAGIQVIETPDGNICTGAFSPSFVLKNYGSNALQTVTILYSIGSTNYQYNWSGNLGPQVTETVVMPPLTPAFGSYNVSAATTLPNGLTDSSPANDGATGNFTLVPSTGALNLNLKTDVYGSETTWTIKDSANNTVFSGGPYADDFNGRTYNIPMCLPPGCYTFSLLDSYGDGMSGNVTGSMTLTGQSGAVVYAQLTNPGFGYQIDFNFCIQQPTDIQNLSALAITVVPNPSQGVFNLSAPDEITRVTVANSMGQQVYTATVNATYHTLPLTGLAKGIYLLKAEGTNGTAVKKLIIE